MKRLPVLFLLMLAAGAVACDENPISPTEIRNVTWKLESIERPGSATITVPNPELYTVRFENNGNLAVRADCNTCGGRYSLNGSSLSVGDVACTLIACAVPGLDTTFTSALRNVRSATASEGRLVITGTDFTLRLRN
jgi:heat shock protein HslJ